MILSLRSHGRFLADHRGLIAGTYANFNMVRQVIGDFGRSGELSSD